MLPTPEYARKLRLVGFSDQGGRPDGVQLIVVTAGSERDYAGGVRVYDISDPFRPVETAAFVAAAPARLMDDRPGVPQISAAGDVFVDAQGLLYTTDQNGGLSILERT